MKLDLFVVSSIALVALTYSWTNRPILKKNALSNLLLKNLHSRWTVSLNSVGAKDTESSEELLTRTKPDIIAGASRFVDIDFCLRDSDTALSGPSRSKILNEVTNDVFKAIIIGFDPIVQDLKNRFDEYRERIESSECSIDESFANQGIMSTEDLLTARIYIDWLERLLVNGLTQDSVLGSIYDRCYKKLLTALKDAGCVFSEMRSAPSSRPQPNNANICLSLTDNSIPKTVRTRTRELNLLSNAVARVLLYGGQNERYFLASHIEKLIPSFAQEWTRNNLKSQEIVYLRVLVLFIHDGLAAAQSAMSYNATSSLNNGDRISGFIGSVNDRKDIPQLRLLDAYQNAFQRVVETCLTEFGTYVGWWYMLSMY